MKRILFIMQQMPGGGAEKVLIDILNNFDYGNYSVTLLLEYRDGVYLGSIPKEVEVVAVHGKHNLWYQRLHRRLMEVNLYGRFFDAVYAPMIRRKLRGRTFDVIISFLEGAPVKIHSCIAGQGVKNISWVHIDFRKKHWSLPFFRDAADEQRCYALMDKIIFVSRQAEASFAGIFDIAKEKLGVVYNLIDAAQIRQLARLDEPQRRDRRTICMVGRLNQQKRYDRAIAAMKMLVDAGYNPLLKIFGIGELEPQLRKLVSRSGLDGNVKFMGFVRQPYREMADADVFLNSSESEGYPLTICEALCLGLPVVATDISGASEILEGSKWGILVEETPQAIFEGLKRLLDDEEALRLFSAKSLERSGMFDVSETMRQIYSLFEEPRNNG